MIHKRGLVLLLCAAQFFALVFSCAGLDLMLKNGKVYRNVTIINRLRTSVQINSDPYGNGSVLISTRLRYRDLTPGSLRKVLPHYPYLTAAFPPDRSRVVQVRSITMMGNGTFGWVQGFDRQLPATPERFGRFFIDGLHLPQGGTWVGRIYPTDRTVMRFGLEYPCYTVRRKVFSR